MKYCYECVSQLSLENAKFCPMCGNDLLKKGELDNNNQTKSINFEDSRGDVIGVGVSGSGHIIGKNMVIGSGTINPNEKSASKNP